MVDVVEYAQPPAREGCELECLLAQAQRMHDLAVDGEWEKVAALECERKRLIDKYFSQKIKHDAPERAARYIQEVIELDKKVIAMGLGAKKVLGSTLVNLQHGRQATRVYQKIGS